MSYSVYLDQNVLTELRINKLEKGDFDYLKLARLLMTDEFCVRYSRFTLIEIDKIGNQEHIDEHLKTLNYLHAIYWDAKFPQKSPDSREVYKTFKKTQKMNFSEKIENKGREFIKAVNGIDTGQTLEESFNSLVKEVIDTPFNFLSKKMPVFKKPLTYLNSKAVDFTLKKMDFWEDDLSGYYSKLIPEVYSIVNHPSEKKIESFLPEAALKEVVRRLINYDSNFINIFSYNSDNVEHKLEFFFYVLNWVGYFPDKFQNATNKKGFHEAYVLDSHHAGLAWHFNFVISNDEKFRKKVKACYSFISAPAKVMSVKEFIQKFD